jgi:hypothetical protein
MSPASPDGGAATTYSALFADHFADFAPRPGAPHADWQDVLFGDSVDASAVKRLSEDESMDARVRALACLWLRSHGVAVPPRRLFGIVVEVPIRGLREVLAAYSDGSVRYFHGSGGTAILDRDVALEPAVRALHRAGATAVAALSPWTGQRPPPPTGNRARLSFVVSDGLYFGEGQFQELERDMLAGPVLIRAAQLVGAVVALSTSPPSYGGGSA